MRDRGRIVVLAAVAVLLLLSWAALTAATHGSHQSGVATRGADHGAARSNGTANTCELCQKPITAKNEATLEAANGSVHHYACIECALISARDYFQGDVTVRAKSAERGAKIEWARHQGKWQASPASAVVMSLPEKSGNCQQDHLAFKDAAEFNSYAKTHANAAGHRTFAASQVNAILQAGKQPAPKETTCPVMHNKVHPNGATEWTVYEGKTYYFCCAGCKPKFASNPAGYLSGKVKPPKNVAGMKGGACGSHGDKGCGEAHAGAKGGKGGTCGGNDIGCAGESGPAAKKPVAKHKKGQSV